MGGPRARIKKLEQGSSAREPRECPRCAGVIGVFYGGDRASFHYASRRGEKLRWTPEEWASAFPDGRCLLCGETPVKIVVVYDGESEAEGNLVGAR